MMPPTDDGAVPGAVPAAPGEPGAAGGDPGTDESLAAELDQAREEAQANWDRYLRAEADLENLRRRGAKLREEALARQRRDLLARFLDVADNLERALAHGDSDPAALVSGVEGTYRELTRILASEGVQAMSAGDDVFDPERHEAVGVVPLPGADEERIVSVERTGYTIDGELLRPARVIVGQPAPPRGGTG
jgi:molecular chaperone GrpE